MGLPPLVGALVVLAAVAAPGADAQIADTSRGSPGARIWYAHNSGWFVETARHLLVFDYVGTGVYDTLSALKDRLLRACEAGHRRLVVFVSHEHDDHFSPVIYKWRKRVPSALYVLGLATGEARNRLLLAGRADTLVEGMRIRTIHSTDLGVGFLVNVDGLVIFHAGDHAQWDERDRPAYRREIDWLAELGERIDLAFLPIASVYDPHVTFAEPYACEIAPEIRSGASYALRKLRSAVTFPMHVRCMDQLHLYRDFAETMSIFASPGSLMYAERLGEGFEYDAKTRKSARLTGPTE